MPFGKARSIGCPIALGFWAWSSCYFYRVLTILHWVEALWA